MIVADASVLIALSKMQRLGLLKDVYDEACLGPVVKTEVVDQGREIGARGVEQVETALDAGWLKVVRVSAKERRIMQGLLKTTRLDDGEAESLAVAQSRRLALILDDKEGRAVAAMLGVSYLGTAGVFLEAFLRGRLSLPQLEEAVQDLSQVIWLSPAVVAKILKRAREAKR